MAMSKEELKELVKKRAKEMTKERYREIEKGLEELGLGKVEMLAWIEINEDLGKWGTNWQFAKKPT